ncbi:ribonuclease H-like domain-containing protein [Tanacetum coccineum]
MWLFRYKYHADGILSRYKARLMANGITQLEGVDIDETFSLVVKPSTIRTVLSLATSLHWLVHQLDVKNAFLHGDLSETVYMHQPSRFWDSVHPDYGTDTAYLLLYVDDIVDDIVDEVFSTWKAFGGNTRDLGSFGEETDKITDKDRKHLFEGLG